MSMTRMRYLLSELEQLADAPVVVAKPVAKGFFAMKEELTTLLETIAQQLKERQTQMTNYGRTRQSVTLGIKAQRNLELAHEKLAALERQVEQDHSKWISPISDEEYEARKRMCTLMRSIFPKLDASRQPVMKKIAAAAKKEKDEQKEAH